MQINPNSQSSAPMSGLKSAKFENALYAAREHGGLAGASQARTSIAASNPVAPKNPLEGLLKPVSMFFKGLKGLLFPGPPATSISSAKAAGAAEMLRLTLGVQGAESFVPRQWEKLPVRELGGVPLHDPETGFNSAIYRNRDTGEVVVAYRGSDGAQNNADWKENLTVAVNDKSVPPQHKHAIALAHAAKKTFGSNLSFAGRSLGGGLAMSAGLATGQKTVAFDPLAPNSGTLNFIGAGKVKANAPLLQTFNAQGNFVSDLDRKNSRETLGGRILGENNFVSMKDVSFWSGRIPILNAGPLTSHKGIYMLEELERIAFGKPDVTHDTADSKNYDAEKARNVAANGIPVQGY